MIFLEMFSFSWCEAHRVMYEMRYMNKAALPEHM